MLKNLMLLLSILIPVGALFAVLIIRDKWRKLRKLRPPVETKLLRPPAESLRKKIEHYDEKFMLTYMWIFFFPLYALLAPIPTSGNKILGYSLYATLPLIGLLVFIWRLVVIVGQRNDHILGFNGERAVGEELNKLMLDGCHVFHDFPKDTKDNIDHIVVAPSGVYAIETKTRRKRRAPEGKRDHEVTYDGRQLHFPHCTDAHGLDQAQRNAKSLSSYLASATGEKVWVDPILTLPGWMINRSQSAGIPVLNPKKEIRSYIVNRPAKLTAKLIQQIVHQLDQKCRDVEF
jgi:hypothetical protein